MFRYSASPKGIAPKGCEHHLAHRSCSSVARYVHGNDIAMTMPPDNEWRYTSLTDR